MTITQHFRTESNIQNRIVKYVAFLGRLLLIFLAIMFTHQSAQAQVDCSLVFCSSAAQQTIRGFQMFDEDNFNQVVDGLGRIRRFWVHIPAKYYNTP